MAAFAVAVAVIIYSAIATAGTEQVLAEADALIAEVEERAQQKPVTQLDMQIERYLAAEQETEAVTYTWNQEMMGKVVAFEVGWCCEQCKYLVASACINRFYEWYGRDVIAMIEDNNGEYYMMNPEYVYADEENGFNFWEHYDEIMPIVARATDMPANCYFWDNADTQRDWAELMWHCPEDGCWFYR